MQPLDSIAELDGSDPCRQVFTLFYRNRSSKNAEIKFVVTDNFHQKRELDVSFQSETDTNETINGATMDKSDLRIEQLQQYLDKKKGVVESNIKEYSAQLESNYLYFFWWHADDLYKAQLYG